MLMIHSLKNNLQRGVGLIEVLVALLVLGVGLLGLAGLQSNALRFNQDALFSSQATTLSYDILERMRANMDQALTTNNYTQNFGDPYSAVDCESVNCLPSQMADHDVSFWLNELAERLPEGRGKISFTSVGSSRVYTITSRWLSREQNTVKNQSITIYDLDSDGVNDRQVVIRSLL